MPIPQYLLVPMERQLRLEDEIRQQGLGKYCTACPTSHYNSGNILHQTDTDTAGKKLKWPGWTTNLVQHYMMEGEQIEYLFAMYYDNVVLRAPSPGDGDQHLRLFTPGQAERTETLGAMVKHYIDQANATTPRLNKRFWVTRVKKEKIITIWTLDVVPKNYRIIQDVDLSQPSSTSAPSYYFVSSAEYGAVTTGTPYSGQSGQIIVTEAMGAVAPIPSMAAAVAGHELDEAMMEYRRATGTAPPEGISR